MYASGYASYHYVNGDEVMLADLFTKNKSSFYDGVAFKLSIVFKDLPSLSTTTDCAAHTIYSTSKRDDEPTIVVPVDAADSRLQHAKESGTTEGEQESPCMCMDDVTVEITEQVHHDEASGDGREAHGHHDTLPIIIIRDLLYYLLLLSYYLHMARMEQSTR